MKKFIIWASILALGIANFNFANANDNQIESMTSDYHNIDSHEMDMQWEYGIFTDMVRNDLSEVEKSELKALLEQQKAWVNMIMETVKKVKSWELNNFKEFTKIATKRKAMVDKLKVFMKDEKAFEYICMNHWDELVANLFTDDSLVEKYKKILLKNSKSKIESIYSKKWKDFEKIISILYIKNIDSKNIKNISIIRALELIIEDIKKWNMSEMMWTKMSEITIEEFWDFTEFAKKDLNEIEKEALIKILSDRKVAQENIKKLLSEAKMNWTLDETFEKVEGMRLNCKARFSPYIDQSKMEEFNIYCKMLGEKLKNKFK